MSRCPEIAARVDGLVTCVVRGILATNDSAFGDVPPRDCTRVHTARWASREDPVLTPSRRVSVARAVRSDDSDAPLLPLHRSVCDEWFNRAQWPLKFRDPCPFLTFMPQAGSHDGTDGESEAPPVEDVVTVVENVPFHAGRDRGTARDRCWLTLLAGPEQGAVFRLEGSALTIGRSGSADVHVGHEGLSRLHARLSRVGDVFVIEDLQSANGTYVRGQQVDGPTRVFDGDRVQLGQSVIFKVNIQDELEEEAALRVYGSSVRDGLTGLYNRHYFDDRLEAEFAYARRHAAPLTLLMLDIDLFKNINDTHGHQAGDAVLGTIGAALLSITRKEDVTARYGGEEFALLLRGVPADHALLGAERLRRSIESTPVSWKEDRLNVTVSVGVATMGPDRSYSGPIELVAAADSALYAAKREGRNRVTSA
jgi:two-component system, cell cycle response regulator